MAAGTVTQFLVAPQVYNEARSRIWDVFHRVEVDRGMIVPDAIRLFLTETVMESLSLRHDDWAQPPYIADPGFDSEAPKIAQQIETSLVELLRNADAEPRFVNGKPEVTFVGIVKYIYEHWCSIFPFCR
jgi:hypothetical protein